MPPTTQSTAAPSTSDERDGHGVAAPAGTTFWPRLTKEVRSRVTKRRFIITAYWTGSGRSRPKSLRTAARVSGEALRPAMRAAGSEPGVAKKIRNTSTLMPNITNSIWPSRREDGAGHGRQRDPDLGARVERVAHAVAQDVEREHGQHDGDAGRQRHPGPGVEQRSARPG